MDRILIILKKENGPRASSASALGLNTIIFKYVYWYMKQISGERLQDHWSSGLSVLRAFCGERLSGVCIGVAFHHICRCWAFGYTSSWSLPFLYLYVGTL